MNVLRIKSPQQKQRETAEQPKRPGGDREGHSVNQENEKSAYYLTCHPECLLRVVTCASQTEMSKIVGYRQLIQRYAKTVELPGTGLLLRSEYIYDKGPYVCTINH